MKRREAKVQCYRHSSYALVGYLMNPHDSYVAVIKMHDHGIWKRLEQDMNRNCPLTKMDLEMGFIKLNKCNMTWQYYDAPKAIYCKQ